MGQTRSLSGGPMNGSYASQFARYRSAPQRPTFGRASMDGVDLGQSPVLGATTGYRPPQTNMTPGAASPQTISNSFWNGSIKSIPTMPGDIGNFRQGILSMLPNSFGQLGVDPNTAQTQSLDQLGGPNSAFFQNMMASLRPTFDQNTALALAQAKESAGNLTGSGFANTLGTSVNRSLADQNQLAVQYATQALQQEMQRQQQEAQLRSQILGGNADRYGSLINSFGNTGVGPNQIVQQGGASSLLPGLGQIGGDILGKYLEHKWGSTAAGAGSKFVAGGSGGIIPWLGSLGGFAGGPLGLAYGLANAFPQHTLVGQIGRAPGKIIKGIGHLFGL